MVYIFSSQVEMDLDTAYIEPLIHDWMEHLQQIIEEDEQTVNGEIDFGMPFVAIPESTISAIFTIASHLEVEPNVKYMAIHLFDKFMCNYFWEIYKSEIANGPSKESWDRISQKMSSQSKLYLLSCFQLACKMDSHSNSLGLSQIYHFLCIYDKKSEYTQSMIISSEFKVFKTVGFKMPLYTPLHYIEILLAVTGLRETPKTHEISLTLLDLAFLQHEKLYSHLQNEIQIYAENTKLMKKKLMLLKSNMLFLSTAIVVCTTFFLSTETDASKALTANLARLSNTTDTDIWKTANILYLMSVQE